MAREVTVDQAGLASGVTEIGDRFVRQLVHHGAQRGHGILSVRDKKNGGWSSPALRRCC